MKTVMTLAKPLALLLLLALLTPSTAWSQGILIDTREDQRFRLPRPHHWPPRPIPQPQPVPQSYKIQSLEMGINLQDQVAKVQVSQTFVNTGSRQMEVCFVFPLPYDGAVDRMTFMVDGTEFEAKLLSAEEARRIYEGYIRRNQDPALLEWMGTGMFKTSVFPVPPGASRTVTLRYTQVCQKVQGLTELLFPLSTAKYTSAAVEKLQIDVAINSQVAIKNVYSPTHSVEVQRPSKKTAHIRYRSENEIPTSDFRLLYDVGNKKVGAKVLTYRPDRNDDGYFLMLVSPEIRAKDDSVLPKTVVFVVDRSGSMSGKKIEQAREALKFVLNNLNEGDLFNIIAYDSSVESFRPELQRFNDQTRGEALGFVEGIYAGGSTNISGALTTALDQLKDDQRPNYVVFLTDGLPTAGETNETRIVQGAESSNKVHARVFSFGVGYDVNSRLLDKLSRACFGVSHYVRPNEDIEEHVSQLYNRIGAPALTNVQISFDVEGLAPEKGSVVNRVYPRDAYDLFAGDQLVVVGRYKHHGTAKVVIQGTVGDDQQKFDFPAELVKKSNDDSFAFVEKLWATRRIGEIIDEIDLNGQNPELVNELVALSTKHGILTPYTSFLADETVRLNALTENRRRAGVELRALSDATGEGGFSQRLAKNELQQAANAPAGGRAGYALAGEDKRVQVNSVMNVANKTFYWRNEQWIDSTVTEEQQQNTKKIERYSDEYFELARKLGKQATPYLALEGRLVVVLDGVAYEL